MGISSDGVLCFGINLGEELPKALRDEDGGHDWDDWLSKKLGIQSPKHRNFDSPEWKEYFLAKTKAIEAFPVELVLHCSYDYPMYIIAVNGTKHRSSRGYAEQLPELSVSPEQVTALRDFCKEHNIAVDHEPCWILASMYG